MKIDMNMNDYCRIIVSTDEIMNDLEDKQLFVFFLSSLFPLASFVNRVPDFSKSRYVMFSLVPLLMFSLYKHMYFFSFLFFFFLFLFSLFFQRKRKEFSLLFEISFLLSTGKGVMVSTFDHDIYTRHSSFVVLSSFLYVYRHTGIE